MKLFNSIKFKISVFYTLVFGLIIVIHSGILYFSLYRQLYHELDRELKVKAQEITRTIDLYLNKLSRDSSVFPFVVKRVITFEGNHAQQEEIKYWEKIWRQKVDKLGLSQNYLNFVTPRGQTLGRSKNLNNEILAVFLKILPLKQEPNITYADIEFENRILRVINSPFLYNDRLYFLQIGSSQKPILELLHNKLKVMAISIPVIIFITSLFAWFLVSKMLDPVAELTKIAKRISHEDLSTVITAKHVDEEMKDLVVAFNDMVIRLQKSFKHIMDFSSQVAHELRTPLAIMRGESELALRKERDQEEYERVLKVNLEEIQRMMKTIDDLLLLTKLDYRPEIFKFQEIDFILFFKEMAEQCKLLAAQKGIAIELKLPTESLKIKADELHLRRLFFNILDNAIKFTDKGGQIKLCVDQQDKEIHISISDTGLGIPPGDLPKIFERFYHGSCPSHFDKIGSGLGLSIAQSIANIHQGDIKVESQVNVGTTFKINLPLSSQSEPPIELVSLSLS